LSKTPVTKSTTTMPIAMARSEATIVRIGTSRLRRSSTSSYMSSLSRIGAAIVSVEGRHPPSLRRRESTLGARRILL
jgi:hypothetical protein